MADVILDGRAFALAPGESVLDGMRRYGVEIASACRAGVCHACLLRAVRGDPGSEAQRGLKDTWRSAGYFLACQACPSQELTIARAGAESLAAARVASVAMRWPGVLRVRIRADQPLEFRPGQHLTLHRPDGLARAYSIANLPAQAARDGVEFHVRARPGGEMSGWLARTAPGTRVGLRGPSGDCFYLAGDPGGPLLLAGTGTGIGPLAAVTRDAVGSGHTGPVVIVHAAAEPGGLYLDKELNALAAAHPQVRYRRCLRSHGDEVAAVAVGELARLGPPTLARAYLCGGRGSVLATRRALFLAGMSLADIYADEFIPALPALRSQPLADADR